MNYLFPFFAAVLWGANTVITKLCSTVITPVEIGFYRWLVATLVLTPFVIGKIMANAQNLKPHLHHLMLLGFLGGVIYQSLAYYAAHYTTATNMGIIQSLMPVIALILASIFLGHVVNLGSILGAAVSAIGVVIVVSHGDFAVLMEHGVNRGDVLILAATVSFALYGFFLHKWKLKIPLLQSVYIQSIVATAMLFPFFVASSKNHINIESGFYIGFAGIAASILAPLVWMHGISKIGAARASLFFNLIPIVTAILAALFLSEKMSISILIGGGLAIIGVVIAEFFRT